MWHELLKRKIERGETSNLKEVINTMFAAEQLTVEQYNELIASIKE